MCTGLLPPGANPIAVKILIIIIIIIIIIQTRSVLTYLLTYLLTPRSRILLEKLTGFQLVKKFPAFYETRRFITAVTSAPHLSLS